MGGGPAGEVAVSRLNDQGLKVALVERELVGGECAYWACIPSKTLLRPPEARAEAGRSAGVSRPDIKWAEVAKYRDYMIRNLDDTAQVEGYRKGGVDVFKGEGRIAGPGQVEDGDRVEGEELWVATGRAPRVHDIGLENVGIDPAASGISVDECCHAGDGLWAIGDVTGVMPFTHVGMYQGRITAADIAGEKPRADYTAIPRVVFSDPEIAAVGVTEEQARARGIEISTARVELADAIARPWTYEKDPHGELGLIADRKQGTLIGAWAVAPLAGEWIHYAALAVKTQTPISVLRDTVAQFPTFTEAYLKGVESLEP
jgi:dihydrolipoamide dehydrogenase